MARLLTGLQPSGTLHIGNYLGALRPFVELSQSGDYEHIFLMVVDYHALTSLKNPKELKQNIISIVADYVAAGIDPNKVIIFKQSDVPQHTELAWIFSCQMSTSFLELGHAFKDKVAKGIDSNVGLFTYPLLMAADILLYDATDIPVGEDQRQHIEYTREIAAKFNINYPGRTRIFNESVKERIFEGTGIVPGVDGAKMSKSYGNTIPLFASDAEIKQAVMSVKTGSEPMGSSLPVDDTVLKLFAYFDKTGAESLAARYRAGTVGYKEAKELLAQAVINSTHDMRVKRRDITDEQVEKILMRGKTKARAFARKKMDLVHRRIGVEV
ncbi:MAG: tryptophan--tRNA ligase [Candidatus Pacebacteria bacterium]|nr:tryptophan--tRNA ligase [Candidatus Paceibacterota bacterium]